MKTIAKQSRKKIEREEAGTQRLGVQVIARAAAVLRALERSGQSQSLGELAKTVGLPRSTVQRIVDALDREGLVIAASATSGVRLGPALISLAEATQFEIADLVRPALMQLAMNTGETVDLAVLGQDKLVFIDHIEGKHRLRAVSAVGVSFPLHCSANGKAMLAAMSIAELSSVRKHVKLTAYTKSTLTTWKQLDRDLDAIRIGGIATDHEEHTLGICAIAMAFRSPTGELAAVSIPVPTQRFKDNKQALVIKLSKCIGSISNRLKRVH